MQYNAIPCNTMQYHAIPCIINNCWRSVPLPYGQYNGHFYCVKTNLDIFYSGWSALHWPCHVLLPLLERERLEFVAGRVKGDEPTLPLAQLLRCVSDQSTSNYKYSLHSILLSTHKDSLLQTRPLALLRRCWPLLHLHVHPHHRRGHQIQRQKQDCCFLGETAKYWFRINVLAIVVVFTPDFKTFRFCFLLVKRTKTVSHS